MILLLLPFDVLLCMASELLVSSEDFRGLSKMGDLIDSLLGCLLIEAFIDLGMHFECPEVDSSLFSAESICLQVL